MDDLRDFLSTIGQEVEDAEEESFLLFSQSIPSSNLGFVDSKATTIEIPIHETEYTIHQSPTLLSSSRAGGTTGAVLWKITPLFAEWLSSTTSNPLWTSSLLSNTSTVVELGCGISGLTALTLSPLIGHYLATDQEYVARLFRLNLESNPPPPPSRTKASSSSSSSSKGKAKGNAGSRKQPKTKGRAEVTSSAENGNPNLNLHPNITFTSLDWETDNPDTLKRQIPVSTSFSDTRGQAEYGKGGEGEEGEDKGFDLLVSCDCIYNEALIAPFVRTCAEISRLRPGYPSEISGGGSSSGFSGRRPTICIVAQQQRSPEVFETWLVETMKYFRVWRVADEVLGSKLGTGSGYLVHVLVLKG
ncbi:hypothetical protein BJX61DRAFT_534253 [Aspergillus egyptiacus]|nr:hypothetical protein BJX61DRAFT_534253 [Aspergillus egyptiacus]